MIKKSLSYHCRQDRLFNNVRKTEYPPRKKVGTICHIIYQNKQQTNGDLHFLKRNQRNTRRKHGWILLKPEARKNVVFMIQNRCHENKGWQIQHLHQRKKKHWKKTTEEKVFLHITRLISPKIIELRNQ